MNALGRTQRMTSIRMVDKQIEELKERLRVNHVQGMTLIREIVRLEAERHRFIAQPNGREEGPMRLERAS